MAKKKTYEELLEENLKLNKRIAKMKEKVLKDQLEAVTKVDFDTMIETIIETQRMVKKVLNMSYTTYNSVKNIAYKTRAEYNKWD